MTIEDLLTKHEGRKNKPYPDHKGVWTIGIGHNLSNALPDDIKSYLDANGEITDEMISRIFAVDIQVCRKDCETVFPDFENIRGNRSMALLDWAFVFGLHRMKGFHDMIPAVNIKDWEKAAVEMLDSDWARDPKTTKRAEEDARMLRDG